MKIKLNKNIILKTAANMADTEGIASVTLKALAEQLNVKSPSLYKHINGLEELNKELMLYGWKSIEKEMTKAAVGRSKDDAIIAMCIAFRNYIKQHPGVFETMQRYNMYNSKENLQATEAVVSVVFQVFSAYDLSEEQTVHLVRILRSFLQGFLDIEIHGGFGNSLSVEESFDFALKILLNGIHDLHKEGDE